MRTELKAAISNHERGRLDEADSVYQRILAENPHDAVVWNLSGVVAQQKGDHRRAIELISRAISLNPREAAFHANVAEAYRAIGLYEQAALRPPYNSNRIPLVRQTISAWRGRDLVGSTRPFRSLKPQSACNPASLWHITTWGMF